MVGSPALAAFSLSARKVAFLKIPSAMTSSAGVHSCHGDLTGQVKEERSIAGATRLSLSWQTGSGSGVPTAHAGSRASSPPVRQQAGIPRGSPPPQHHI